MSEERTVSKAPVVAVDDVVRRFKRHTALAGVSMRVQPGRVFGLVGENGAGKTTLIRCMLGLLQVHGGRVRVFGRDPVADPVGVLRQVGYVSEDRDLPDWMRVGELIRYTQAFYPDWDEDYAEALRRQFGLDESTRVRHLSRGQRAQAALLIALAYRPALLLLDEPSSGLDPVVRRGILGAIVRTVADEGRTVVFSSHLLDEVERVADDVAMMHEGRLVLSGPLDEVKAAHRRVTFRFAEAPAGPPALAGALWWEGAGREWTAICDGRLEELRASAAEAGAEIVDEAAASLEEVFVARAGAGRTDLQEG
ncbi:MAG: ABC transporter ATP-binding protein [Candidatus Hydrogenedentes bacterium]|nr:ABC transporter ATP-binding protein [Candidatus Hydrogenedentota bacterium]